MAFQEHAGYTERVELRPVQGGAEDTEERVLTLVLLCPLWKAMLLYLSASRLRRLVYGEVAALESHDKVGQACERVRLLRLTREACFDPLEESRRHRGVCLDVAEHGVRSAVETTSAMVKLAFELSLACRAPLPRDYDSYCEAREGEIEESASGRAGYGMVSHVAEGTEERAVA